MSLSKRDKKHIWHPLTQHQLLPEALGIQKTKGALLLDEFGNEYIDAIASWYTAIYGHCHPKLIAAAAAQMENMDQIVFAGFTHEPAIELSEKLIPLLPFGQNRLFFSENGSTSVDIALKMAIQYFHNQGERRKVFVAFEEGFHGDTFGAMSVSGLSVYNGAFEDFFISVKRIPIPNEDNLELVLTKLEKILQVGDVIGFIYEPLVQGAAGMKMYKAKFLCQLLRLCKQYNVLKIADEVMTGFGKTRDIFASLQATIQPDIVCLSKALTAGMVPMGITSCTETIFNAFLSDKNAKGFFHGHTYTANPIACKIASVALDLYHSTEMKSNKQRIEKQHQIFCAKLKNDPRVKNTRNEGIIMAFELSQGLNRYGKKRNEIFQFFMDKGIFLRPLGNTIYLTPPFVTSNKQLNKIYETILACLNKFGELNE